MPLSFVVRALIVIAVLGGCSQGGYDRDARASAENAAAARIIIKFRAPADVSEPAFAKQLARTAGVSLAYVRPLSGGAHLYRVEGARDPAELAGAIERLSKRPDVEYVEPDRILRIK